MQVMLTVLVLLVAGATARAQDEQAAGASAQPQTLNVGVYVSPPFVLKDEDGFSGMAVDLWNAIADRLELEARFAEYESPRALVEAATAGEIDAAVTNLTITQSRAQRIDFTHPWFDAGLRIMVNQDRTAGIGAVLQGLSDSGHLRAYAWLALVILAATVGMTFFDRHFDKDFPRRWREGLAESFYAVMSIATSGKAPARKNLFGWLGRIWQAVWLVCGIAVLAYVTSSVTSVMTTLSLTNQITNEGDLPGKTVGVFAGSVAEDYARESGLRWRAFPTIEASAEALLAGRVDAVVGDAPVLEYYAHTHPDMPLEVVGPIFEPDKYGFGLAHRSPLTRPITVEMIGMHESGRIEELRTRYFGDAP